MLLAMMYCKTNLFTMTLTFCFVRGSVISTVCGCASRRSKTDFIKPRKSGISFPISESGSNSKQMSNEIVFGFDMLFPAVFDFTDGPLCFRAQRRIVQRLFQ